MVSGFVRCRVFFVAGMATNVPNMTAKQNEFLPIFERVSDRSETLTQHRFFLNSLHLREMSTTLKEALAQLEALSNETVRARNWRNGAGDNQFGVQNGDIRKVAAKIKSNHALGLELWE